jgi:hypothetical protein
VEVVVVALVGVLLAVGLLGLLVVTESRQLARSGADAAAAGRRTTRLLLVSELVLGAALAAVLLPKVWAWLP